MLTRRIFLKQAGVVTGGLCSTSLLGEAANEISETFGNQKPKLKLSLAQWSLHRAFWDKSLDPIAFAQIASDTFDIKAVEYVNGFYEDKGKDEKFWAEMKSTSDNMGVTNLLIMIDNEGDLGDPDDRSRKVAVENHFKWVNAAKILGCHSIRVNAFGEGEKDQIKNALVDGMGALSEYAEQEGINVLIENHGLYSSDARFITSVIREVDLPNFGTLPDFGNWCLSKKWGSIQDGKCESEYDRYQGVSEFLPFAKSVSAKSYDFDENGNQPLIDYKRMLQIVKDSGFDGYIGIEYEGDNLSEPDGIRATKKLIERTWDQLD